MLYFKNVLNVRGYFLVRCITIIIRTENFVTFNFKSTLVYTKYVHIVILCLEMYVNQAHF